MSAPVDVLGILAEQIEGSRNSLPHLPEILHPKVEQSIAEVESVRTAVAQLIEAAEYGREWIIEAGDRKGLPNGGTLKLLDAALARVKGGAA